MIKNLAFLFGELHKKDTHNQNRIKLNDSDNKWQLLFVQINSYWILLYCINN